MRRYYFFSFFLVSGLCSLIYEVVWLRLAMARFGVVTPLLSVVLASFMAGIGLGSYFAGELAEEINRKSFAYFLRLYALTEFLIGLSAFAFSGELNFGKAVLERLNAGGEFSSLRYHVYSGGIVTLALLPWCIFIGATFPLALAAIKKLAPREETSFSYLYVANVTGAVLGTVLSAFFLIELLGFSRTQLVAASLNFLLAVVALCLSFLKEAEPVAVPIVPSVEEHQQNARGLLWLLFLTGLTTMGMEVIWIRLFTPYTGTLVYGFAAILSLYLIFTVAGSRFYRRRLASGGTPAGEGMWLLLGAAGLMPMIAADPRLLPFGLFAVLLRLVTGIGLFSFIAAFLTPMLIDLSSRGNARRAGRAYAINVIGCILGPLVSGFILLPRFGERWGLLALSAPICAAAFFRMKSGKRPAGLYYLLAALTMISIFFLTRTYEESGTDTIVKRDYTATVVAAGTGRHKVLLVNGTGMTILTPITKVMAHLPLSLLEKKPERVLVICFGMGTSFRSALSWGASVTGVELVPSVPELFPFFHPDARRLLLSSNATIVVDDGRRFMERSKSQYDLIIVDPPPPVEAAGSSLLYSREFFDLLKTRLKPGGILQEWLPGAELLPNIVAGMNQAFPHVRVFRSIEDLGFHILASSSPITVPDPDTQAARFPSAAAADLLEWSPDKSLPNMLQAILSREVTAQIKAVQPSAILVDDHPLNEYYLIRHHFRLNWSGLVDTQKSFASLQPAQLFKQMSEKDFSPLAKQRFYAISAQDAAFLSAEDSSDFLAICRNRAFPPDITAADIETIRSQIQSSSTDDSAGSHYRKGMFYFFLAYSQCIRSPSVKVDPEEIARNWESSLDEFSMAGEVGLSMGNAIRKSLSAPNAMEKACWSLNR